MKNKENPKFKKVADSKGVLGAKTIKLINEEYPQRYSISLSKMTPKETKIK